MKTIILAGGFGTRISEFTETIPKPMIKIGNKPVVWHIMNHYYKYGFKDFILALGYKGEKLRDYFINYNHYNQDIQLSLLDNSVNVAQHSKLDWNIVLSDTGLNTLTGGRIKRLSDSVKKEAFMVTYGDGICNVDLGNLLKFHKRTGKLATVTAVRPAARFGELSIEGNLVKNFKEKPQVTDGWINGGYFIFEPEVLNYIKNDQTILEKDPLEILANEGQLAAYKHHDFWMCLDTKRDYDVLQEFYTKKMGYWS